MTTIAAVELAQEFGDVDGQLAKARAAIDALPRPADVIVLSETILTGYVSPRGDFDLARFAEPIDGPTSRAIAAMAKDSKTTIVAPLVEREGERVFNAMIAVDANGALLARYRKRHPWYPETWATPGADPHPLFRVGDLTLTIAICFDVHFLASEGSNELGAADALLFPSAWVDEREGEDARAVILPALARRFGVAVVNANWAPSTPRLPGQGGSRIIDRDGCVLATVERGAAVATLSRRRAPA